jgi:hypothetical protein
MIPFVSRSPEIQFGVSLATNPNQNFDKNFESFLAKVAMSVTVSGVGQFQSFAVSSSKFSVLVRLKMQTKFCELKIRPEQNSMDPQTWASLFRTPMSIGRSSLPTCRSRGPHGTDIHNHPVRQQRTHPQPRFQFGGRA